MIAPWMQDPNCDNDNVDLVQRPNSANNYVNSVWAVIVASLTLILRVIILGVVFQLYS